MFRSIRFGVNEAHGRGIAIQLNYMLDKGAFRANPDGTFSVDESKMAEAVTGRKMNWCYVDENRIGDHICYYSDLRKMQAHYAKWRIGKTLPMIFEEIAMSWKHRP